MCKEEVETLRCDRCTKVKVKKEESPGSFKSFRASNEAHASYVRFAGLSASLRDGQTDCIIATAAMVTIADGQR